MQETKIKALIKYVSSIKPISIEHILCPQAGTMKNKKDFQMEYVILTVYECKSLKHLNIWIMFV